jgi:hypothetical protein
MLLVSRRYYERRRGRSKQLLDDLKVTKRYRKLREELLDSTVWGTCFGRGYGPFVRLIAL